MNCIIVAQHRTYAVTFHLAILQSICQETLEGHQRAIMGNMTVEQIYKDRVKFSTAVFEVASSSLVAMGINVISYTIKSLSDENGYLEALGMTRTAQVSVPKTFSVTAQ